MIDQVINQLQNEKLKGPPKSSNVYTDKSRDISRGDKSRDASRGDKSRDISQEKPTKPRDKK